MSEETAPVPRPAVHAVAEERAAGGSAHLHAVKTGLLEARTVAAAA
jgi:hypothetical protein